MLCARFAAWLRPPLLWHRTSTRRASELYRASQAWNAMARVLLSNRRTG
jgi:hypothetical protein